MERRLFRIPMLSGLIAVLTAGDLSYGKPEAPSIFCDAYGTSELCGNKGAVDCAVCHTQAPNLNGYGTCLSKDMVKGRTQSAGASFSDLLVKSLRNVEGQDCDGDSVDSLTEIQKGSLPGDGKSVPTGGGESESDSTPVGKHPLLGEHWYRRVSRDICGATPRFKEMISFRALSESSQEEEVMKAARQCLDGAHWMGKEGVLWSLGHRKIGPLRTTKSGDEGGAIPLADYYDDYNLFVYTQSGDRDARDVLLADYYVVREGDPAKYRKVDKMPLHTKAGGLPLIVGTLTGTQQLVPKDKRAGLLSTMWTMTMRTMFTSVPRTTAAAALRSFLNVDIAKSEGLTPPAPGFVLQDYDAKGVTAPACAYCHNTLDPATYVFMPYNGISAALPKASLVPGAAVLLVPATFNESRAAALAFQKAETEPNLAAIPKAGYLFGKPVRNLREWATVAANSDEFVKATVNDYWMYFFKVPPTDGEHKKVFAELCERFKATHNYRVEGLVLDLIQTEVYRAP